MSSDLMKYVAETWPNAPQSGGQWDAWIHRIGGLSEVYSTDTIKTAIREMCDRRDTRRGRPPVGEFADFLASNHGTPSFTVRDQSKEAWSDKGTRELIMSQLADLDEQARDAIRARSGASAAAVCEWLCRDCGVLAVVELCKRGLPAERIKDAALVAVGRYGDD